MEMLKSRREVGHINYRLVSKEMQALCSEMAVSDRSDARGNVN